MKRKQAKQQVPAETFVRAWQEAESVDAVVKATGLTKANINQRAFKLRKNGVPLKKFNGVGREKLDYKALAKLAKECAK